MSTTPADHGHEHATEATPPPGGPNQNGTYAVGIVILVAFGIFVYGFFSGSDKTDKKEEENSTQVMPSKSSYTKTIEVSFDGEYGSITYLPSGFDFSFLDATEPYVAINAADEEVSGEKGQDASTNFATLDGMVNTELRFKSQNGKKGKITIFLISKN